MPNFPGEGQPADSSSLVSSVVRDRFDALYQGDFKILRVRQQTPSANMTVWVESDQGRAYVEGNNPVNFPGGNSPSFAVPGAPNKRIDLLTIDKNGSLGITQGTAASTPVAPGYPVDKMVLAEIYIRATATSIKDLDDGTNGYIFKRRQPMVNLGAAAPLEATFSLTQASPGDVSNTFSRSWRLITNTINQIVVRVYAEATNSGGGGKTGGGTNTVTQVAHDLAINHNRGRKHAGIAVLITPTSTGPSTPASANVEVQYS